MALVGIYQSESHVVGDCAAELNFQQMDFNESVCLIQVDGDGDPNAEQLCTHYALQNTRNGIS